MKLTCEARQGRMKYKAFCKGLRGWEGRGGDGGLRRSPTLRALCAPCLRHGAVQEDELLGLAPQQRSECRPLTERVEAQWKDLERASDSIQHKIEK